ncbi:MAG: protein kinase, partial [Bdellovibrionaceae bacterium]|nr:protein kinase [Pseudobdellovibrionaceae bacterium]
MDLESKKIQIGSYSAETELGSGATSIVYRAHKGNETVALKVMRSDMNGDIVAAAARFRKEAEILSRIKHPALVQLMELGEYQGLPYMALELIKGQSLNDILSNK